MTGGVCINQAVLSHENLLNNIVAITCSLDVAGRRAIYFPYEI